LEREERLTTADIPPTRILLLFGCPASPPAADCTVLPPTTHQQLHASFRGEAGTLLEVRQRLHQGSRV
jgi:hypothetical protein